MVSVNGKERIHIERFEPAAQMSVSDFFCKRNDRIDRRADDRYVQDNDISKTKIFFFYYQFGDEFRR